MLGQKPSRKLLPCRPGTQRRLAAVCLRAGNTVLWMPLPATLDVPLRWCESQMARTAALFSYLA